ncbi:MAG: cell division protein FtsZ [bacterium]
MKLKINEDFNQSANIKVIGLGGGGGNAVNRMVLSGIKGVEFIAINTDVQALKASIASDRLQIGETLTRGLGVGGDPDVGRQAAEESRQEIKDALKGTDMLFITAGLGGGTGTGGSSVIAEISQSMGILTVAVVTKPFVFEGKIRARQAEEGLKRLNGKVDTLIAIPNQRLFSVIDKNTSMLDSFKVADDILRQGVQSIADIITQHGIVNVDFADVKTIIKSAGNAFMGVGFASGSDKAKIAAHKAVSSPLLEDATIEGATRVLVNITSKSDIKMYETEQIMKIITHSISHEANVIFGAVFNENMEEDGIKVTVITAGFTRANERRKSDLLPRRQVDMDSEKAFTTTVRSSGDPRNNLSIPAYLRRKRGLEEGDGT